MNTLTADPVGRSFDPSGEQLPSSTQDDQAFVRFPSDRFTSHGRQTLTFGEWLIAHRAAYGGD